MKKLLSIIIVIMFVLPLAACGEETRTVGGYEITEELYEFLGGTDEAASSFLATYALADKHGYDYKSDSFTTYFEGILERFFLNVYGGDSDALKADIEENGMTADVYEKVLEQDTLKNELYTHLIYTGVIVTDEDVVREKFASGEAVRVKRILIDPEKAADDEAKAMLAEAKADVESGKSSFEKKSGNLRGYGYESEIGNYSDSFIITKGNYDKVYEDACFSLEVGEISEPFESESGWCIVKRYELSDDILDEVTPELAITYAEGQYNILLEEAAAGLLK